MGPSIPHLGSLSFSAGGPAEEPKGRAGEDAGLCLAIDRKKPGDGDLAVKVDGENTYEITQKDVRLPRLPKISVSDRSWAEKLARVLSQVARYQALARQYTDAAPSQKLPLGHFQLETSPDTVKDGKDVSFSLTYSGAMSAPLWVSVYCFTASWGVVKVDPLAGSIAAHEIHFSDVGSYDLQVPMGIPAKLRDSSPPRHEDRVARLQRGG